MVVTLLRLFTAGYSLIPGWLRTTQSVTRLSKAKAHTFTDTPERESMAGGVSTVVSTKWLADKLATRPSNFRVLDGSWHLPTLNRDPKAEFLKEHIPTAQFFDIEECVDKNSKFDHMLPSPEEFSEYVGNLGIDNNTHVVVYDNNEKVGMLSAQRVWWTFRVFGYETVSVLDGGLPKWKKDGYEVTDVVEKVEKKQFKAVFHPEMVVTFEEMVANLEEKKFTVADARPPGRFEGTAPEPRPDIKPGHMPGAINVPFLLMLNPETKTLKTPEEMKEVFKQKGIDIDKPLTSTCGSGISATMLVLACHLLDKHHIRVYDGSWTEWFFKAKKEHILSKE